MSSGSRWTFIKSRRERSKGKSKTPFHSMATAAVGLFSVLKTEGSVRSIALAGIVFSIAAFIKGVTFIEGAVLAFVWVQVMVCDIFNTALEKTLDYASNKEYHKWVKLGKDFAASTVLLVASFAWIFSLLLIFRER